MMEKNWQQQPSLPSDYSSPYLKAVAWNGKHWLTVGGGNGIFISEDGLNWQSYGHPNKDYFFPVAIAWSDNQWVIVGEASILTSSADDIAWQEQFWGKYQKLTDVNWNGKQWMVVGEGILLTSNDGIVWQDHLTISSNPPKIDWDGDKWVAAAGHHLWVIKPSDSEIESFVSCAFLDEKNNIELTCVLLDDKIYQAQLKFNSKKNAADGLIWNLSSYAEIDSIVNSEMCSSLDAEFNLNINCIRVGEDIYQGTLNFIRDDTSQTFKWNFGDLIQ